MSLSHRAKYPQASWSQPKIFLWGKKWSDALKSLPTIEIFIIFALFSSDQKSQSLATMENYFINSIEHFYHDDGYWSLHIYMKPMIPLQFPLSPPIIHKSGKSSTILEKRYTLRKKVSLTPKKVKMRAPKKSVVSKQLRYVHFAKNQVQFGQFWPQEPHFWSTDAYRGSPPCAIFHNPDNREI